MTMIFLELVKKPSYSFSMISFIRQKNTFDLDDVFEVKFLLQLKEFLKFLLIL